MNDYENLAEMDTECIVKMLNQNAESDLQHAKSAINQCMASGMAVTGSMMRQLWEAEDTLDTVRTIVRISDKMTFAQAVVHVYDNCIVPEAMLLAKDARGDSEAAARHAGQQRAIHYFGLLDTAREELR